MTTMKARHSIGSVCNSTFRTGGGNASAIQLIECIANSGHRAVMFLMQESVINYKLRHRKSRQLGAGVSLLPFVLLKRSVNAWPQTFTTWLYLLERIISRPYVTYQLRRCSMIIDNVRLSSDQVNALRQLTSAKLVLNHAGSVAAFRDYWLSDKHESIELRTKRYLEFLDKYDAYLFQSQIQADELRLLSPNLANRCLVAKPSVDENAIERVILEDSPFSDSEIPIVAVGWIQRRKRFDLLVKSLSRILKNDQRVRLYIIGGVGDQQYFKEIKALIADERVEENVFFVGHRDDFLRFIAHARVFVQTSNAEGISRALREAHALSVPCVVVRSAGLLDMIDEGSSGLVAEDNLDSILCAVSRIIYDDNFRAVLAAGARQKFLRDWSNSEYQKEVFTLLNNAHEGFRRRT